MSKQVNYNENLCAGAAIRDDKGRRISKLFEASHPKMTVGYAKNLIMPDTPTEQEFNFRKSGGGVIEDGVAVIDKVKGNSVVWNQKFPYDASKWYGGAGSMTIDGSVITLSCGSSSYVERITLDQCIIAGHKYYTRATIVETTGLSRISLSDTDSFIASDAAGTYSSIKEASSNADLKIVNAGGVGQGATFKDVLFVDLTQMFGAGNEPSTVEEFLQRKPKVVDEYAYNEGTIVNNKVEGCRTVGLNQFNPNVETEYLAVTGKSGSERYVKRFKALPGTYFIKSINNESIYVKSVINGVYGSANALNRDVKITLDSYGEIWIYSETEAKINGVANDICINLSDPIINGKYFPYEEHTLDLSWVKEIKDAEGVKLFEDGMKSAGTAFDEAAKGRAIKRIGVKVFDGTEDWALESINSYGIANFRTKGLSKILSAPLLSAKYPSQTTTIGETQTIGLFNANESSLYIRELSKDFASVDAWKAHLADLHAAGTPLVVYYGLDTPIEVEYDEKNLTYPVVAGGTEEAIESEPSSAFRADIGYGIDAVKTILDLKARVEALEAK